MSRRHLESALVAGAFIESGLTPCFRFTRIRFVRYCFPPGYDSSTYNPDEAGAENQSSPTAAEGLAFTPHSTLTTTCTCCPDPQSGITSSKSNEDGIISAMLGKGDCEEPSPVGTSSCKLHTEEYLIKHPWRRLHDDYAIHSVQFSPDGRQLLAGSANTSIRVIQTADGSQRLLPRPSKWTLGMPITAIRFMPPKLVWAVACNSHGEVFAFNPEREGFETLFKEPQQTYALDFSPDGTELATGGVDKKIRIYTLQPGSVLGMPSELHDPCESATDGAVTNRILVRKPETSPYHLFRVDAPKHTRLHFPGGRPDQIVDTTVRPYVLTRCYGTPDILDSPDVPEPAAYVNNPKLAPPLREYVPTSPGLNITEGHSMRIMALRYHPQKPSLLFSAGWDNLVKLWDTRLQTGPVWQIYGPHVASPDGLDVDDNYLLTASWRAKESIEIWDLRAMNTITGKQRAVQFSHQSSPRRSQTTDDGDSTVLGSLASSCCANTKSAASSKGPTSNNLTAVEQQHGPCEVIPIAGSVWVSDQAKESGEYPYAARLLPSRAIVAAGSGFHEVRVIGRDTLLPIARIPMDSVVQSMDTILDGRYIGVGCSSGTVSLIGMA